MLRPIHLRPLKPWQPCTSCNQPADWKSLTTGAPICAHCYIYESAWGKANKGRIEEAVSQLQSVGKNVSTVPEDGKLTPKSCNDVLGLVVLSDLYVGLQAKRLME